MAERTKQSTHHYALDRETVRQRQEHKRSNAAGKHLDKRTKRLRTRGAAKKQSIQMYS